MRALIAFDKFKDAIDAPAACAAAAEALRRRFPSWELDLCPLADGGEGFSSILTRAAQGELRPAPVIGPLSEPQAAHFGLVRWRQVPSPARRYLHRFGKDPEPEGDDLIGVVEMAVASGLAQVPPAKRDPWKTTSFGTGQLLRFAAEAGARTIVIGVGGSATNDLGIGALSALGWGFLDSKGTQILSPAPSAWSRIARVVPPASKPLPTVAIACDVENPLLGPRGATAIYGPQKGLARDEISVLDQSMAEMAQRLTTAVAAPPGLAEEAGTGAAGGIVFGLRCAADAWIVPGFDLVQAWLDIERRIGLADLVITGEGRFDSTSLSGKGPGALALRALALGKKSHVFAGSVRVDATPPGLTTTAITPPGMPLEEALRSTSSLLQRSVDSAAFV